MQVAVGGVARIAAAVTLVLTLGGCSGEQKNAQDPGSADSASPSSQESAATPSESPTVAPATGPKIDVEGISIRLPEGWEPGYDTSVAATAGGREGIILLSVHGGDPMSLRALMKRDMGMLEAEKVERLDDVTLARRQAYHFSYKDDSYKNDVYGLWDRGYRVHVVVRLRPYYSDARRRKIVESVIATYG